MSYAFDVMSRVFDAHCQPLLAAAGKEDLAARFSLLIEAMHSANHCVPSANGVFKGDGVNKDSQVGHAANELDEADKEISRLAAAFKP